MFSTLGLQVETSKRLCAFRFDVESPVAESGMNFLALDTQNRSGLLSFSLIQVPQMQGGLVLKSEETKLLRWHQTRHNSGDMLVHGVSVFTFGPMSHHYLYALPLEYRV